MQQAIIGGEKVGRFWQLLSKYRLGKGTLPFERSCRFYLEKPRWVHTATAVNTVSAKDVKPLSEMPGQNAHWIFDALKIFFLDGGIHKSFYKRQETLVKRYGPLVRDSEFGRTVVLLANPVDVATIFRTEARFPIRESINFHERLQNFEKKEAGIFFLNGEKWHKHKSALSKRMLRPPEIKKYIPRLNFIADDALYRLNQARNQSTTEKAYEIDDLDRLLFRWSLESVADVLFDKRLGALSDEPPKETLQYITDIENFLHYLIPVYATPPIVSKFYKTKSYRTFFAALCNLYEFANRAISENLENLEKQSSTTNLKSDDSGISEFIPFLLSSNKIKPEEIESSIVDTLFAGVDTTSNTLQWMLYLLAKNQDKQEILRNEVDLVYHEKQPSESTLNQIPYLKACIKETLRLYPVLITTDRVLEEETVLSGYLVPAGTVVRIFHHAMGRRAELFEEPNSFIPERWLRKNHPYDVTSFASLPFGHGRRMCLGRRLAELELQLLTLRIVKNYKLEYPKGEVVEQFLRGTSIPDRPLRIKFLKREH